MRIDIACNKKSYVIKIFLLMNESEKDSLPFNKFKVGFRLLPCLPFLRY